MGETTEGNARRDARRRPRNLSVRRTCIAAHDALCSPPGARAPAAAHLSAPAFDQREGEGRSSSSCPMETVRYMLTATNSNKAILIHGNRHTTHGSSFT